MDDVHKLTVLGLYATNSVLSQDDSSVFQIFGANGTVSRDNVVALLTRWFGKGVSGDGELDVGRLRSIAGLSPMLLY